tara:strand:- start:3159 stop:4229 length:1071 start_codon:yes stop_codon:yes gene_type:complete
MANQNIRIPRFYTDLIGYHRARGASVGSITATNASNGFIGLPTSNTVSDVLDLRPLNQVTFDTSADTDGHVLFNVHFTTSSYNQTYVAILNHNLNSCDGRFKIFAGSSSSDITALDGANVDITNPDTDAEWNNITTTEIVNADTIAASDSNKTLTVTPASDGTTLLTFDEQDLRFWAIQFEGNTAWDGSTDFKLGGIMIGEHYDMPHAPDLQLNRRIHYDKVKVQESVAGQKFAVATSLGRTASDTSKSPFALGTYGQAVYGGRIMYDMNFSSLQGSDVLPSETTVYQFSDDSVVSDIWNMTDGPHRPFIFCIDNTSTGANAESEFMFARFNQDQLAMQQVAPDVYNINMSIAEEF